MQLADGLTFLNFLNPGESFSVVAMKIVPISYQKTAEVYSSEAPRFYH